ncbi:hypothetical protein EVAR_14370_1 [Eumeta japonica]|uniref:Uncharacterized protein n=1 Tax=Eumeta variegata TaxID=151549 RepID=A0A4C1TX78_EUMVA|nr:hypothetical protein EVAR_14370_1 [Eumeta japonica]
MDVDIKQSDLRLLHLSDTPFWHITVLTFIFQTPSTQTTQRSRLHRIHSTFMFLLPYPTFTAVHTSRDRDPTMDSRTIALTNSNRTRLSQYEREILKDMLQGARNQPKLKTQEILEGKTITKIIKILAKGCTNTGWLYTPVTHNSGWNTLSDNYAPFGVSGLVSFSHCDWLKVE